MRLSMIVIVTMNMVKAKTDPDCCQPARGFIKKLIYKVVTSASIVGVHQILFVSS